MSKTELFIQMLESVLKARTDGSTGLNESERYMLVDAFNDAVEARVEERERAARGEEW